MGSPHFANIRASILKTLGHGVQTTRSKPSRDDTMQTSRRALVHFEDLGAWWPMLATTWDLASR